VGSIIKVPGQWNDVKMTFTVATAKVVVQVATDGSPASVAELPVRGTTDRSGGQVQFGDERVQNGAVWRVHFDDVAMSVTP
jgi:hypothetical protein